MQPLIFDNFLREPLVHRDAAILEGFVDYQVGPTTYHGINVQAPMSAIWINLQSRLGKIDPVKGFYRVSDKDSNFDSYIHADKMFAGWAAVLYLTPPDLCQGGTAFWLHKETSQEMVTDYYGDLLADWTNTSKWKLDTVIHMKWNRCIVYPTRFFHSPWPFRGFGDKPGNSRMIWGGFFNML